MNKEQLKKDLERALEYLEMANCSKLEYLETHDDRYLNDCSNYLCLLKLRINGIALNNELGKLMPKKQKALNHT
jgi:hypothetical protein